MCLAEGTKEGGDREKDLRQVLEFISYLDESFFTQCRVFQKFGKSKSKPELSFRDVGKEKNKQTNLPML